MRATATWLVHTDLGRVVHQVAIRVPPTRGAPCASTRGGDGCSVSAPCDSGGDVRAGQPIRIWARKLCMWLLSVHTKDARGRKTHFRVLSGIPLWRIPVTRGPESAWGHPDGYATAAFVWATDTWLVYTDLGRVIHRVPALRPPPGRAPRRAVRGERAGQLERSAATRKPSRARRPEQRTQCASAVSDAT